MHTEQIWVEHQAEQAQLETSGPSSKSRGRRASGGGGQPNDQKNQTTRLDELAGELDSIVQDAANIFILTTTTQGGWFDSKTASPEEKVFERELANHVRRCVEELDERSRQIVKMSFFESRSIYYIADELGLSPSWISRLRSQALEKLRTLLPGELVP